MSFRVISEYETAAEALAAVSHATTGILLINPNATPAEMEHVLTVEDLRYMAKQEAKAPDPEETP